MSRRTGPGIPRLGRAAAATGAAIAVILLAAVGCASAPARPGTTVTVTVMASPAASSATARAVSRRHERHHRHGHHRRAPAPPAAPASTPASTPTPTPTPAAPSHAPRAKPRAAASCWATASVYNAQEDENNVYVHSNQPYREATASADGHSWSYETNGSGYAEIYLNGPPPGALITVTIGGAVCTTRD